LLSGLPLLPWRSMPLAVCLTGQLRWAGLALGMFRQFVLLPHAEPHNLFYVGPADDDYTAARPLLRTLLGLQRKHRCVYDPHVSWEWLAGADANASAPERFELHGSDLCTRSRERAEHPRLVFKSPGAACLSAVPYGNPESRSAGASRLRRQHTRPL
jgi:hypothetical protein